MAFTLHNIEVWMQKPQSNYSQAKMVFAILGSESLLQSQTDQLLLMLYGLKITSLITL